MVQVIVKMTAIPRQAAEVIRAFRSLKFAIQSVKGLVRSHLYLDADLPDSICYIEEWQNPEQLGQAAAVEHFTRLFELMERSSDVPKLSVNTVGSTRGFDYLSELIGAARPNLKQPESPRGTSTDSG